MALLSLPIETESLARAIHKFQCDIGNRKASCIKITLQELVNRVATTKPINPPFFDIPRRKTRAVVYASSRFYDSSWLTNADKFPETITRFKEVIANSQIMDSSLQQSIASAVTFAIAIAITFI